MELVPAPHEDHTWEQRAEDALRAIGYEQPTEDQINYMATILQAFEIYNEREGEYGKLWKSSGSEDNAMQIKSKAQRMIAGLTEKVQGDSALDCINYSVFYFINKKEGR
jgi:hypothetical protein